MRQVKALLVPVLLLTFTVAACKGGAKPPVARPMPPPDVTAGAGNTPARPEPPQPVAEPSIVMPPMPAEDKISGTSIDDLNRDSPLRPLFFLLDASDISPEGQQVLQANAAVLKKYPAMQITIEGHCDERGTAEYNLALGERRAVAVKTYLVSLGVAPDRVRTVSYGKKLTFDPGHTESAWSKNRRGHFVITAK